MAKSFWLINSNRSEVKRFMNNDISIYALYEYMSIWVCVYKYWKIVGVLGKEIPVMKKTVFIGIDFI